MSIKALVFDFDGLIVDTETPEYHAWQDVYRQHGAHLELSDWLACVGTSQEAFNPVTNLKTLVSPDLDEKQILQAQRALYRQRSAEVVAMPGVLECIADARRLGLRLAIASSSDRRWVESHLEQLGLRNEFEHLCTSDNVSSVKPDPELYLCALRRLGVVAKEAVAFEDSLNGLLSARSAGLFCVVVPNFVTRQLDFSLADRVLSSLADIPLETLLQQLEDHRA